MNPARWLLRSASCAPAAPALLRGTTIVADYATFCARAAAIAGGLRREHDIRPGDRVAIFAGNRTQYLEALYGIWFAGAVAVPINGKLHLREAAWILGDCGAKLVFVDSGTAVVPGDLAPAAAMIPFDGGSFDALAAARPMDAPSETRAGDLVWLFYTSGTTGRPKGVKLSAANLTSMALCYEIDVDAVHARDAILYAAPMSHGAGLYNFMHVIRGARHVVPDSGGFDADEILGLAAVLGNVSLFAAPTMVRRLVDAARRRGETGRGIKTIIYGGGPMYRADIIDAVTVMGPRFVQIYGQGECPMAITALPRADVADRAHPRWQARLGSVGRAQSVVRVAVLGPDGSPLSHGEIGEVAVHGLPVMQGYWRNDAATAETLAGGWLHTGDMGALDADGYLTLHDRSKDVIISGGTNIYPREVEEALLTHPGVHEVSVIGRPDSEWGESVAAFVVPAEGATLTEMMLDSHCRAQIARFKRPKVYFFVAALPKNNYGKVLKTELRARLRTTG